MALIGKACLGRGGGRRDTRAEQGACVVKAEHAAVRGRRHACRAGESAREAFARKPPRRGGNGRGRRTRHRRDQVLVQGSIGGGDVR